jgi:hypothetical protein
MKPEHIEIAEQIARDASCAQGEFGQRVLSIIPYLTEVCDRAALPPLRAREEIARDYEIYLSNYRRAVAQARDILARAEAAETVAADALSRTAGQEWRAFDPAKLSDGELILCLEELRSRDTACLFPEPIVADKQTEKS